MSCFLLLSTSLGSVNLKAVRQFKRPWKIGTTYSLIHSLIQQILIGWLLCAVPNCEDLKRKNDKRDTFAALFWQM